MITSQQLKSGILRYKTDWRRNSPLSGVELFEFILHNINSNREDHCVNILSGKNTMAVHDTHDRYSLVAAVCAYLSDAHHIKTCTYGFSSETSDLAEYTTLKQHPMVSTGKILADADISFEYIGESYRTLSLRCHKRFK